MHSIELDADTLPETSWWKTWLKADVSSPQPVPTKTGDSPRFDEAGRVPYEDLC